MTPPRRHVLVVSRPYDLSDAEFDGFVKRHIRMVETIARDHHVTVMFLRMPNSADETVPIKNVDRCSDVILEKKNSSRAERLIDGLRSVVGHEDMTDRNIAHAARMIDPDVVVTIGPWLNAEYRAIFRRYPTLHLFEEDLTRMAEVASQSIQALAFRRIENWLHRIGSAQPSAVVSISENELQAAKTRYPSATHMYLPFTLPHGSWPEYDSPSAGEWVLVAGNLAEGRNSEGLVDILEELKLRRAGTDIRVRLVSDNGLDPALLPYIELPWVNYLRPGGSLVDRYREAWVSLVPAMHVSGQKTTILQAWACGSPVVCSTAAAATVNAPNALIARDSAAEIATALLMLSTAPERRRELVLAGRRALAARFNPDIEDARMGEAMDLLAEQRSRTSVRHRRLCIGRTGD